MKFSKKWNKCKNKNKAKWASWVWRIFIMFPDSSELFISFSPVACNSIQADKLTIIFFLDKCCVDVRSFLNKKVHFIKGTEAAYSEPWNKTIFYTSQFEHIWDFFLHSPPAQYGAQKTTATRTGQDGQELRDH